MSDYSVDLRDVKFTLFEMLDLDPLLKCERFSDFDADDFNMIIEEAYKLARDEMADCNAPGDREGCKLEDGKVTVPEVYRKPYETYTGGGWLAINANPEFGGQGLPDLMRIVFDDVLFGANIALNLGMLLTPGAAHLIEAFAADEVKQIYCEKMYSGVWTGTMCLTEPQAGSDLAACTCKAIKQGDHYLIQGEKTFITFGDHNLTDNVIHTVLARTEDAPKGTRGLSLFVVPKHRVNDDGSVGEFNDVECTAIEHKLGINGSPTCSLAFGSNDGCHGWLVGNEGDGIKLMFQMMNEARISVGLQGGSLANAAYQYALAYAMERQQGSELTELKNPDAPRVPIIRHPDVRVMLLRQKAYSEGIRALLYFAAYTDDVSKVTEDDWEKNKLHALVEILTPICKAYGSDMGFRVTEWALQTYGGYGYCNEYPVEQLMRDVKIASLYEGTNGIQAMDLVGRKLGANGGANLMALAGMLGEFIEAHAEHPQFSEQVAALEKARDAWNEVNMGFVQAGMSGDFIMPMLNATTYLSACGDMLMAYFLLRQAILAWEKMQPLCEEAGVDPTDRAALRKLAQDHAEVRYFDGKIKTARFFVANELPNLHAKLTSVGSGDTSAMDIVWVED